MILNNCIECLYNENCPCGYSFHNAACLTLARPNEIMYSNVDENNIMIQRGSNMGYKAVPEEYDFNTEFDTYIIAFCPDTDEWFATKQRFWFYEYPKEFETYQMAVEYFEAHLAEFNELRKSMSDAIGFYYGHEDELWFFYEGKNEKENENSGKLVRLM